MILSLSIGQPNKKSPMKTSSSGFDYRDKGLLSLLGFLGLFLWGR